MNKVIIIDNYDSFTYNLVHIVEEVSGSEVTVVKNDEIDFSSIGKYTHIILSPGPGIPKEAGALKRLIETIDSRTKVLGVCLGLQAIGEVYGAQLQNLNDVYHGMRTIMHQTNVACPIFKNVPKNFYAGRYHSWVINKSSDLSAFEITARDEQGEIMALHHKTKPVYAVQFHPESIMTDEGKTMISNFLSL